MVYEKSMIIKYQYVSRIFYQFFTTVLSFNYRFFHKFKADSSVPKID